MKSEFHSTDGIRKTTTANNKGSSVMRTFVTLDVNHSQLSGGGMGLLHHQTSNHSRQVSMNGPSAVSGASNKSLGRNPGAGGLFDEALIRRVNLAAAFHDHISCTKLPSEICKAGGSIAMFGYGSHNTFDPQAGIFGSPYSAAEDKEQINMLKDMILVHLDLIQHQQEQLLKKDRQLQGLKQDREALCVRLEKTEKRVAILTKKVISANETVAAQKHQQQSGAIEAAIKAAPISADSSLDSSSFCNFFTDNSLFEKIGGVPDLTKSDLVGIKSDCIDDELTSVSVTATKKRIRKSDKNISPMKRVRPSKSADSESSSSSLLTLSNSISNLGSTKAPGAKESRRAAAARKRRTTTTSTTCSKFAIEDEEVEDEIPPLKACAIPKDIHLTEMPYELVSARAKLTTTDLDLEECDKTLKDAKMRIDMIEVPSWRICNFATLYTLEGTEVKRN